LYQISHNDLSTTIGGIIGQGAWTFPIIINEDDATSSTSVKIPTTSKIWACKDTEQLKNLLSDTAGGTPPIPEGTRTRLRSAALAAPASETTPPAASAPAEGEGTQTQEYVESSVQIPLPILAIAALETPTIDPLDLIIAVKNAANDFNDAHKGNDDFKFNDATIGAKKLAKWLYAVHLGLISETRLSIKPENKELTKHAKERHCACILLPINQRSLITPSTNDNKSIIRQLIMATNCNNKACEETNRIRKQEYERLKGHDDVKKDKTKDLHASIKIMIKNTSAATRDKSGELCLDLISLYNSKTHGGLNIQLHQLFKDAGMDNVVFAEGVSTNLWAGNIGRAYKSAPGVFSPFSFSKMKALSASGNNRDRSLLIDIYLAQKGD
jgi:hypothetical protein